ncbi:MAG TPA: hypothetical protein VK983_02890 [Candidatus Limnocylindrales bacterium]|nr:hypothetical protein [Candidatus Limnocylindrales bacterium]
MKFWTKDRQLTPSWHFAPTSFKLVLEHLTTIAYLSFLPALLLNAALAMIVDGQKFATGSRLDQGLGLFALAALWSLLAQPGFIYFQAKAVQGTAPSTLNAFKHGLSKFVPLALCALLTGLAVIVGFILFIIPGLIALRAFLLAPFYIVDRDLGPIAALKQSAADTKPVSAWVWGTIGVIIAFSFMAASLHDIAVIGPALSLIISSLYVFGPALRYADITNRLSLDQKSASRL